MQEPLPFVAANVIIGSRLEPFFSSCLASVEPAVDFLVLNDNSGLKDNPNLNAYYASKLFKENRTLLIRTKLSELTGFDEARNICLTETAKRFQDQNLWILYLDSDEVHTEGLADLTRRMLARLPPKIAVVDGYFYQFIQSFAYYASLDRRHNLLFRYQPKLRWQNPVHETLCGIEGKRIPTGYTYFHYGYVYPPEKVLERWNLYKKYGGVPFDPALMSPDTLFKDYEKKMVLVPFRGKHPTTFSLKENQDKDYIVQFTQAVQNRFKQSWRMRFLAKLKELNWGLRLSVRNLQAKWACRTEE